MVNQDISNLVTLWSLEDEAEDTAMANDEGRHEEPLAKEGGGKGRRDLKLSSVASITVVILTVIGLLWGGTGWLMNWHRSDLNDWIQRSAAADEKLDKELNEGFEKLGEDIEKMFDEHEAEVGGRFTKLERETEERSVEIEEKVDEVMGATDELRSDLAKIDRSLARIEDHIGLLSSFHAIPALKLSGSLQELPVDGGRATILRNPELTIFYAALEQADMVGALDAKEPITILAPTNKAFLELPDTLRKRLFYPDGAEQQDLHQLLQHHLVASNVTSAASSNLDHAVTVLGDTLNVRMQGGQVMIGGAAVQEADVEVSNGVLHVIDQVLLPKGNIGSPRQRSEEGPSGLSPEAEIAENPAGEPNEEASSAEGGVSSGEDIVRVVLSRDDFSTFATALEAAGLVENLASPGPYTVFAPTNEAFEQLPEGTLDELLKPENRNQLAAILTYHVVPQAAMAADVADMTEAQTLLGVPVEISGSGEKVMVNDATVVEVDIQASNGVLHVIDTVLLPPSTD